MDYWKRVFSRTFNDVLDCFGVNRRKAVVTFCVTLIAAELLAFLFGPEKAGDKLLWYSLLLLASWGLFFVAFVFFFLFRTLSVLDRESDERARTTQARLEADKASLQSQMADLEAKNKQLENADPEKNIRRDTLRSYIARFETVRAEFDSSQVTAVGHLYDLDAEVRRYISGHFASFTEYGKKQPLGSTYTQPIHYSAKDIAHYVGLCDDRLASLNKLLGYLV